jgi:hypothetical protein
MAPKGAAMLIPKAAWVLKFATELRKARPDVDTETALHIATDSHGEYAHLTPEAAVELYMIDMPPDADDATGDA